MINFLFSWSNSVGSVNSLQRGGAMKEQEIDKTYFLPLGVANTMADAFPSFGGGPTPTKKL